jgi:hypothetical protein
MVTYVVTIATMPPPVETPMFQTLPMRAQRTATPTPLPEQLAAHQEERRCATQDNVERQATRC